MTLAYDDAGNLQSVQDNASQYTYAYDPDNRLTTVNNAGTAGSPQVTLTYAYDKSGNRITLNDTTGGTNSYEYNARNQIDIATQAGTTGSGVAPALVFFNYDAVGNRTSLTRFADTAATTKIATTTYAYDNANRLQSLAHQTAGGTAIASYTYTLDEANRLTTEAHAWNGGNSTDTISYGYTNNNQLTSVTHSNSALANESFSYDANGNRNAAGQTTATGNQIQSDGTFNYSYDAAGNLVSKTNLASGDATIDQWDYRNRLVEVDRVIKGVASVVAVFTYDALNRQIGRADYTGGSAPAPTAPTVGDAGFEAVSVGQGGYAYGPSNSAWTFTSQSGLTGNNSAFTNGDPAAPQGTQVAFLQSYGTISQAVAGWAAGSYTISFQAIQRAGNNQNFQVLVDGAVVGSFQPAGSTYQTDTTAAFTVGAGSHTITFQGIDTVGGDNTAFFDAVSVASAGGTAPQATAAVPATYVGDPGFDAVVVGPGGYAYNPAGSPWAFNGQAGLSGNASGFTNNNPNAPQAQQVAFLQTTGTLTQTITVAVAGSYQLAFAAAQRAGNNQDFQVVVDGTVVGTFRPTGSSYQWYGTGACTVSAGSHTLTFQGLDSVGGDNTAFLDAVSLSGLATPAPTGASAVRWTVYDDQTPLLDFNAAGQLQARYLSVPGAIDELLARQTSSGVAWYLDDRLGSVRDLIDNTGTVIDHIDYTAYGQASDSVPTQGDRFKYAGMEFDAAIGLYYDRARFFDPASGRFIDQDPSEFFYGGSNLFEYAYNEPSNLVDGNGQEPITIAIGVGLAIGWILLGPTVANAPAPADVKRTIADPNGRGMIQTGLATSPLVGGAMTGVGMLRPGGGGGGARPGGGGGGGQGGGGGSKNPPPKAPPTCKDAWKDISKAEKDIIDAVLKGRQSREAFDKLPETTKKAAIAYFREVAACPSGSLPGPASALNNARANFLGGGTNTPPGGIGNFK